MAITYALDTPLTRNPVIAVTVLGGVATITTMLRFYALHLRRVKPGAPEYLIVAALVSHALVLVEPQKLTVARRQLFMLTLQLNIFVGSLLLSMCHGFNSVNWKPNSYHPWRRRSKGYRNSSIFSDHYVKALYGIVLGLIKSSIMLFYLRIFGSKRSFRISIFVTMTMVWMWAASVILETFLLCRPLAYNWDTSIAGTCGDRNATYVVAGTLNLITDLMAMALPLPHILKLQLTLAKKVALCSVFSIGFLVSIISMIRLKSLMEIDFTDITYSVQMGVMWTVIEPELAIICANMPLLKTVVSRMAPGLFSSSRTKHGVSDPQTFERLQDQQSSNIYPMNKMGLGAVRTHISSKNINESQKDLYGERDGPLDPSEESVEDLRPNGKHVRNDTPPGGINVTQNFVVQYRS